MLQDTHQTILTGTVLQRAVVYGRVSGDDTKKEGRNLAGQLEMGRDYAAKKGYNVIAELAEDSRGDSGADIDLPQLNRVREMANRQEFDVLIVREIDRLSRNLAKQLIVEEELSRAGVRVEYVLAEYDDTPEGRLQKHIRATVAEYEREKIKERMRRGKRLKAKAGNVSTAGNPPFGYKANEAGNNLEVREGEAETVRYIFTLFLQGRTIEGISQELSRLGIPTPAELRKFGGVKKLTKFAQWGRATVYHILTNETYAGVWHYGKKQVKKYHKTDGTKGYKVTRNPKSQWIAVPVPAIIDADTFKFVQTQLSENVKLKGRPTGIKRLLSKRVVCGACGYKMTPESSRVKGVVKYSYYKCPAKRKPGFGRVCDNSTFYKQEQVDTAIWNWVVSIMSDEEQLERALNSNAAKRDAERQPIQRQYDAAQAKIEEFTTELNNTLPLLKTLKPGSRAYAAVLDDIDRLEDALNKLEAQAAKLEQQLNQTLDDGQKERIMKIAAKVRAGLDEAAKDFDLRRAVIDALDMTVQLLKEDGRLIALVTGYLGDMEVVELSNSIPYYL